MEKKRNVMCCMCLFEVGGVCSKKKVKVGINKKRSCQFYTDDKIKIDTIVEKRLSSSKPTVVFRPDWYWDRKKYIKKLKEDQRKLEELKPPEFKRNFANPLTGDLSRFYSSTVSDDDVKI